MSQINRVIITGQMLKGDTFSAYWIHNLFSYYIKRVAGLDVYLTTLPTSALFEKNVHISMNIKKIYDAYGINFQYTKPYSSPWSERWAEIYYKTDYNKKAYDYIYSIFKNSLVISYELEECMQKALEYFDIPYIEINLDPIRFLDDIMLCFRTPSQKAYQRILDYRVDEDFLYLSANYLKAFYNTLQMYTINEKNVLFLGQTQCDKTLVDKDKNEIYSILNHKKEFISAVSGYDNIFYKRHPLAKNDGPVLDFINSIGNIKIVDENFYKLVSRNDIKKVCSISSGTCQEAKYFGKDTQLLLKEGVLRQTEDKIETDKYISVYQDFFSLNFWSSILDPFVRTEKFDKKITIQGSPNKLRNSRLKSSVYYAYEDPQQLKVKQVIEENMTEKIKKSFIAYELEKNGEIC